jgi:hypothetical protein
MTCYCSYLANGKVMQQTYALSNITMTLYNFVLL